MLYQQRVVCPGLDIFFYLLISITITKINYYSCSLASLEQHKCKNIFFVSNIFLHSIFCPFYITFVCQYFVTFITYFVNFKFLIFKYLFTFITCHMLCQIQNFFLDTSDFFINCLIKHSIYII